MQPPYRSKELNLTSDGYSDSLAPFGRWHWISCIVAMAPLPYINPSKSLLGFTVKNFRVEPPDGGIGFAAWRSPIGPRVFVVALSRSSVFGFYSAIRQHVPKPMPVLAYEGAP